MIYIENTSEEQEVIIPRSKTRASGPLVLYLYSTIKGEGVLRQEVEDLGTARGAYVVMMTLPESGVTNGEYVLTLCAGEDEEAVERELAQIGEYGIKNTEYNGRAVYEQYEG